MGLYGSGAEMQKAYHKNNDLLKKRKGIKEINDLYGPSTSTEPPIFASGSPDALEKFKRNFHARKLRNRFLEVALLSLLIITGFLVMRFLIG